MGSSNGFENGTLTSNIVIDTTQAAADTIAHVVTDQSTLNLRERQRHIIDHHRPPDRRRYSPLLSITRAVRTPCYQAASRGFKPASEHPADFANLTPASAPILARRGLQIRRPRPRRPVAIHFAYSTPGMIRCPAYASAPWRFDAALNTSDNARRSTSLHDQVAGSLPPLQQHGDKAEAKGPYSSLASVTLMIARSLKREIAKRDAPYAIEPRL